MTIDELESEFFTEDPQTGYYTFWSYVGERKNRIIEVLDELDSLFPEQCPVELAGIAGEVQESSNKIKEILKEL